MANTVKPITIEEEYQKNPDITPDDIRQLRTWLKEQPHLPGELITDVDLLLAYHCCDRSMQVSKQVLDLHFTLRTLFTQFFKDRAFDQRVQNILSTVLCAPLPVPAVDGCRAMYLRLLDPDPRNFSFGEVIRAIMIVFDLWQYEEGTWPGYVIIIDMDLASLGHITRLELMALKKALFFLQECMFTKLKGVHFLRAPFFMDKLMVLLKPFLKKELLDMLHIHQAGSQSIYQHIPKRAFPKEEEGEHKDHVALRDELFDRLRANQEFIKNENRRRVDEALRREKNTNVEQLFGSIQGSFKKLDID